MKTSTTLEDARAGEIPTATKISSSAVSSRNCSTLCSLLPDRPATRPLLDSGSQDFGKSRLLSLGCSVFHAKEPLRCARFAPNGHPLVEVVFLYDFEFHARILLGGLPSPQVGA